jgi:uncharacterized membrane protein YhdT
MQNYHSCLQGYDALQIDSGRACLYIFRVVSFHDFIFINFVKFGFIVGNHVHFFRCNFYDTSSVRDLPYTHLYVCVWCLSNWLLSNNHVITSFVNFCFEVFCQYVALILLQPITVVT